MPPLAVTVWLYGSPTAGLGRELGLMVRVQALLGAALTMTVTEPVLKSPAASVA